MAISTNRFTVALQALSAVDRAQLQDRFGCCQLDLAGTLSDYHSDSFPDAQDIHECQFPSEFGNPNNPTDFIHYLLSV